MSMDFSLPGGKRLKFRFRSCARVPSTRKISTCWSATFLTSLRLQPTLLNIWRARVASESFTLLLWNILDIGLLHQKASITNRSTFVYSKLFTNIRHTVEVSILHSHCGVLRRESSEVCILSPIVEHSDPSECQDNKAWQGFVLFNWRPDTSSPEFSPWDCVIWLRPLIANCD